MRTSLMLFIMFNVYCLYINTSGRPELDEFPEVTEEAPLDTDELFPPDGNPLDDCKYVFLDVGSNFGVQMRKLYEPQLYPNAGVLEIFDKYFGPFETRNISQVCAVGWEPNPKHEEYLEQMNRRYKDCGYRGYILTNTGAGASNTVSRFVEDASDLRDWGAHFTDDNMKHRDVDNSIIHNITIMRLADYINNVVGTRRLPTKDPGAVVMKVDVEGMELEIMTDLIYSGALRHLDNVHTEYHTKLHQDHSILKESLKNIDAVVKNLPLNLTSYTELSSLDDESYGAASELKPMPVC